MTKLFNLMRFSRLGNTADQRSNILLSVISVISVFMAIIAALFDFIEGTQRLFIVNITVVLVYALIYYLNEKRKHNQARILFLSFANLTLFITANIHPKEYGLYLYFLPLIGLGQLAFGRHDKLLKWIFLIVPVISLTLLEVFDYKVLAFLHDMKVDSNPYAFFINLLLNILMLALMIFYLDSLNRSVEEQLAKSNMELEMFFYRTSHDLRAPLASAKGLLCLAEKSRNSHELKNYLSLTNKSIHVLDELLTDLTEVTKIRGGNPELKEVDMDDFFDEMCQREEKIKNGHVRVQRESGVKTILSDKVFLNIIFRNLISNAVKYGRVDVQPELWIRSGSSNGSVFFRIEDNGVGIRQEDQKHIFEMFYRADDLKESGSGLGLFITHNAVEKLEGTIRVESTLNKGTVFTVFLPMHGSNGAMR